MAKPTQIDFLRLEAGLEPLRLRMEKNNEVMYERYMRLEPNDPRRVLASRNVVLRLKSRIGWRKETEERMNNEYNRETPKITIVISNKNTINLQ